MARSSLLRSGELRQVLDLAAQIQDLPCDPVVRRRHLLEGAQRLVGCQVGLSLLTWHPRANDGWEPMFFFDAGWSSPAQRAVLLRHLREHDLRDPITPRVLQLPDAFLTLRPCDLMTLREWRESYCVREVERQAGIDDCIFCSSRLDGGPRGVCANLIVFRPWGDPCRFTPRERDLVGLLHRQLTWLYRQEVALLRHPIGDLGLPPRLMQVLQLLTAGLAEKEIAQRLGISQHTAHDHVKRLYRRCHVTSRGQLLAKLAQPVGDPDPRRGRAPAPGQA